MEATGSRPFLVMTREDRKSTVEPEVDTPRLPEVDNPRLPITAEPLDGVVVMVVTSLPLNAHVICISEVRFGMKSVFGLSNSIVDARGRDE